MSPKEAEKIVIQCGEAFTKGVDGIARNQSLLSCSKAKIRLAYLVHIKELIKRGLLNQKLGESLVSTYSSIGSFLEGNEAEEINRIQKLLKEKKPVEDDLVKKFFDFATNKMINPELKEEINDYIAECYKENK